MTLNRRTFLLGSLLGLSAPTPAYACIWQPDYPWEMGFWKKLWKQNVTTPINEKRLAYDLVHAIATEDRDKLNKLLSKDAKLFTCADGTSAWFRPGKELDRADAIDELAGYINREGSRSFDVTYYNAAGDGYANFLEYVLHVVIEGYGPARNGNFFDLSDCGSYDGKKWRRELSIRYRATSNKGDLSDPATIDTIRMLS